MIFFKKFKSGAGFTLIELLIVMAVIGILAASVLTLINPLEQFAKARDSERKKTLRELANALERYMIKKGSYPSTGGVWCGEPGSNWTTCGADWIPGLLASNEITILPKNPNGGRICTPADRTYLYTDEGSGSCYKLLAHCSPEVTPLDPNDPFYDPKRPTYAWMVCEPPGSGCCTSY